MGDLNGGHLIAKQLAAAGIDTAFGVVAGPMIQTFAAMHEEGINVIGCRHEESAGFMAQAWGYITKKPGIVVCGSGPGTINAVPAMHVAQENTWPLIVLGGASERNHRGLGAFQEADQVAFMKPASKWAQQVDSTERIPEYMHLAIGKAVSGRPGAVYLDFPGDIIAQTVPEDAVKLRLQQPAIAQPYPDPRAIEQIADMLARAERPLVIIGKGAAWADAGDALRQLADLGIPFVASPMGRGTVPDDHPMCMGSARSGALAGADAILSVGARFNWMFQFGRGRRYARGVRIAQIDISAEEFYGAPDLEIGLHADAKAAVEALVEAMRGRKLATQPASWSKHLAEESLKNQASLEEQMNSDASPINQYRLFREIRDLTPRDATIVAEGELTMGLGRITLSSFLPRRRLNAGTTGCMGTGVGYALGAKLARPDSPVIAVLGDYAFGAAAMEVETAVRNDIRVVFVVNNNEGIVGHNLQDMMFPKGGAHRIASLLPARYDKMVEMVGGHAENVTEPDAIRPALERAIAADKVALVNVMTDPKGSRGRGSAYLG